MRLKKIEIEYIKKTAMECFGESTKIYLFGSRVDDKKLGGDIDLYIETDVKENIFKRKLKMLGILHDAIGEQKIDIIINAFSNDNFIYQVAKEEGIRL